MVPACVTHPSRSAPATPTPATTSASTTTTTTSADHARAKRVVRAIETSPLNPDEANQADRAWLVRWLAETKDVSVAACPDLLGSVEEAQGYPHANLLLAQTIFGQAVFQLDHPSATPTDPSVFEAGLRTAIATYRAILRADPSPTWPVFDKLLELDGQLAEYVTRSTSNCR